MIGRYIASGWDLKPIPAKEKGPRDPGWPNLQFSPDELERHVAKGGNVGVRLGASSGDLVDIDLDCVEALTLQDIYLPSTGAVFGRASKPRSHRLYIAAGAIFAAYTDPLTGETLAELRADGRTGGAHQTLIPPSVAGGERREWLGETIEPAIVDAAALSRRVAWLAIGCLVMRCAICRNTPPGAQGQTLLTSCKRPNRSSDKRRGNGLEHAMSLGAILKLDD
jgi:hypothetical protein